MNINEQTLLNIYIPDEIDYVVTGGYEPEKRIFERKETKSHKDKMANIARSSVVKDVFLTSKNTIQTNYQIKSYGQNAFIYDFMNHRISDINNQCLEYIFECCVIDKGKIINPCIWGVYNGKGFLIPANSELHEIAKKNTERRGKTTTVRELKPGNNFLLKDGVAGKFYGKFLLHGTMNSYTEKAKNAKDVTEKYGLLSETPYFIYNEYKNGSATEKFIAVKTLKVSEITDNTEEDKEELRLKFNETLKGKRNFDVVSRDIYQSNVYYVSDIKVKDPFTVSKQIVELGTLDEILSDSTKVDNFFAHFGTDSSYNSIICYMENNTAITLYFNDFKRFAFGAASKAASGYPIDLEYYRETGLVKQLAQNTYYNRNYIQMDLSKVNFLGLLIKIEVVDQPEFYL